MTQPQEDTALKVERFHHGIRVIRAELEKIIVGQHQVLDQLLITVLIGGHCLITGLPGTAKTLMVQSLADALGLDFKRVQFTPDLMPTDVTGTDIIDVDPATGERQWRFVPGPIFANLLLADEINRTPPKTQSALLEAMQEHRVTAAGRIYTLPSPFFVLATQNPIEQEGTYPLPEAQLDRFMFFINVDYPSAEEEKRIARETTAKSAPTLRKLINGEEVLKFQDVVQRVPVPDHIYDTAVEMVRQTRPNTDEAPSFVKQWVTWGAGPRAIQYLIRGAKARAVLQGSYMARLEDLEAVAEPVLAHRILTNFQAQAEGTTSRSVIEQLVQLQRDKA
ncbi:MAG: MoxR family ATPase [Verrucomicrobia bacterium]|nr:MoxR family ATPase [Verrucomicrobiota bacterium]